jgi:hypothetical protein
MNPIVDITTFANGVVLSLFDPSGTVLFQKVTYPKKEVAYIELKSLVDIQIVCLTASSSNFTTAQMVIIANKNKPSVIVESSLFLARNWNGVEIESTETLFDLITNYVIA